MKTLYLNPDTWDLMVDSYGNIAAAESPYAVAQDVASVCRLWLGEARYETGRGIPYENALLGNLPPPSLIAAWYEREAELVPEVVAVSCVISFDSGTRALGGILKITLEGGTSYDIEI